MISTMIVVRKVSWRLGHTILVMPSSFTWRMNSPIETFATSTFPASG
jgi:hypothetical protein